MRKILFAIALMLCSMVNAHTVDTFEAARIAKAFLQQSSRAKVKAVSTDKDLAILQLPENLLDDGEAPFYIFNGSNSFVIVSAESNYGDVIAYSDDNSFDMNDISPEALHMLQFYKQQIACSKQMNAERKKVTFSTTKILETANFGQNGLFWWNACPVIGASYCYAGCGPAAMAIIMKYYGWPDKGVSSNSVTCNGKTYSVDFSAQSYNWDIIPTQSPYEYTWSNAAMDEVAKILYHCGVASNSEYTTTGTATSILEIGKAMKTYFKYDVAPNSYVSSMYYEMRSMYDETTWAQLLKKEIDNDRPCIVMGDGTSSTHIFVCDGYNTSGMFHYNMGWSGHNNGYYSMDSVDGTYAVTLAVIGIHPDSTYKKDSDDSGSSSGGSTTPTDDTTSKLAGHEYVDLGLSSGKLWATANYGATTPEGYGTALDWSNVDKIKQQWGDEWTTPSQTDFAELKNQCTWSKTTKAGVAGYSVTGPNGNKIFLPFSGWYIMGQTYQVGTIGYYWTTTPGNGEFAVALCINSDMVDVSSTYNTEIIKAMVRPVSAEGKKKEQETQPKEYVDLALPSGTKWATYNIGATKPEDYGDYFAWGEVTTKSSYSWDTYRYGTEESISKYTGAYAMTLEAGDDAATMNWGEDWRMPTYTEMNELRKNCTWTYTTLNGVKGYVVKGKNGNTIFLPQAGMKIYSYSSNADQGRYWTSSLSPDNKTYASYLLFDSSKYSWYLVTRSYGHSVRAVYQGAPNAIVTPECDTESQETRYYSIDGRQQQSVTKGINIIRYPNGEIRKVAVK